MFNFLPLDYREVDARVISANGDLMHLESKPGNGSSPAIMTRNRSKTDRRFLTAG